MQLVVLSLTQKQFTSTMDPIRIVSLKLIWAKFEISKWEGQALPEKKWWRLVLQPQCCVALSHLKRESNRRHST